MPFAGGEIMSPQTFADLQRSIEAYGQKQLGKLVAAAKAASACVAFCSKAAPRTRSCVSRGPGAPTRS